MKNNINEDTLSIILLKIESCEKKIDKVYTKMFESDGERSICDIIRYHGEQIKALTEQTFTSKLIKLGAVAGSVTSICAVIIGISIFIVKFVLPGIGQ